MQRPQHQAAETQTQGAYQSVTPNRLLRYGGVYQHYEGCDDE